MTEERKDDDNLGSFYMGRVRTPPEPERVLPKGLLTTVMVLAFLAIIWYAYPQGKEKYTNVDVPIVTADTTPYKSKPEDPGGMEVRHRDSTVFDTLNGKGTKKAEKLLPPQEKPVDKEKLGLEGGGAGLNLEPIKPGAMVKAAPEKLPVKAEPVKKEAAKAAPAKEASAAATYVQFGAFKSKAIAELEWSMLKKKHPEPLKGLTMRTEKVDLGAKGVLYRLQGGKVSPERAKEICAAMKKSGAGCIVVK